MPDIKDPRTSSTSGTRTGFAQQNEARQPTGIEEQRGATEGVNTFDIKAPPATDLPGTVPQEGGDVKPGEVNAATPEDQRNIMRDDVQQQQPPKLDDRGDLDTLSPRPGETHEGGTIVHPYGTGDGKHEALAARDRDTTSTEYRVDAKAAGMGERVAGFGSCAAANLTHAYHAAGEAMKSAVGQLNAVDMLIDQHREIESLLQRIITARTYDPQSRHRLLEMLCDVLIGHMRIEEEIFYPAMERADVRAESKVIHSETEHFEVKQLMTELLKLNPADAIFDDYMADMTSDLRTHIKEEEREFFPIVKEQIDIKKLKELGSEMHKRFAEVMADKHPRYLAFQDVGKPMPTDETKKPADKS